MRSTREVGHRIRKNGVRDFLKPRGMAVLTPFLRSADYSERLVRIGGLLTVLSGIVAMAIDILADPSHSMFFSGTSPLSALTFILLGLALLEEETSRTRLAHWFPMAVGTGVTGVALVGPVLNVLAALPPHGGNSFFVSMARAWGHPFSSPFIVWALVFLGAGLAFAPSASHRPRRWGDFWGALTLGVVLANSLFLMGHIHGISALFGEQLRTPSFPILAATVSAGVAVIGRLGPTYFPIRLLVGPSVRAVLLRSLIPLGVAAILIYPLLWETALVFLNPALSIFAAMVATASILVFLVLRSTTSSATHVERALQESEQRYDELWGHLRDHGLILLNLSGRILVWNAGAERLTGERAEETEGRLVETVFPLDNRNPWPALFKGASKVASVRDQGWVYKRDGSRVWVEVVVGPVLDAQQRILGYSVLLRDFTVQKQAEERLHESLREKEVILKEIHHRVKNNLQVISSLLRLQSEKITDPALLSLFTDSQERVRAMALVHEYLYQARDLAHIDFRAYASNLVRTLYRTHGNVSAPGQLTLDIEPVFLSLDMSAPCGLLLTELVSNSLKYAYPDGKGGPLTVRFHTVEEGVYVLTVADEGVGLPAGLDWMNAPSLGLRLVRLLTGQLRGTVVLTPARGTEFVVTLREPDTTAQDPSSGGGRVSGKDRTQAVTPDVRTGAVD
jgi:PAS domain S-box-containing protein